MQLNDLIIAVTCVENNDQPLKYQDMPVSEKVLLKSKLVLKPNEEKCITVKTKNVLIYAYYLSESNSLCKDI